MNTVCPGTEPRFCSGIPASCPHCLAAALKQSRKDLAGAYAIGAEDMRAAILARFAELESEWAKLRDTYDPRGQWDDRKVAQQEIEGFKTAAGVVRGVALEGVPETQEATSADKTTAPDEHPVPYVPLRRACPDVRCRISCQGGAVMTRDPDNGLRLALMLAEDDLESIEHYFQDRMDVVDSPGGGVAPNAAMSLYQAARRIRALHARIINGRPTTKLAYTLGD